MTARPGLPDLDITPARAVVAPVGFVTARGDDADFVITIKKFILSNFFKLLYSRKNS